MKKILFILTLALLIPFSGISQKYRGIESLYAKVNVDDTNEPDGDRATWLTWAKDPAYYLHSWSIAEWGIFSRFEPDDLKDYVGQYISKIRFRPTSTNNEPFGPTIFWDDPRLRVYVGGSVTGTLGGDDYLEYDPGTMMVDQQVTKYTLNANVTIVLDNPVLITGTEEIWFGVVYYWVQGLCASNVNFEMADNKSYVPLKSDIIYVGADYDEFYSLTETPNKGYCWIQSAYATDMCNGAGNLTVKYDANCNAILSWDPPSDNPNAKYTIQRDETNIKTGHNSTTYTDSGLDKIKPHKWTVLADCSDGDSFPAVSDLPACSTCSAPSNVKFKYVQNCDAVLLTWNAGADAKTFTIKRNGELIVSDLTEKTYIDDNYVQDGKNDYVITSVCEFGTLTTTATLNPLTTKCPGIKENGFKFSIHPNPANNEITISAAAAFNSIDVVNFLGQTVISQNVTDSQITLDISTLTGGIYFVRINSNIGTSVQKFVKQ